MLNSLTIDVEDWYHVCGVAELPLVPPSRRRVAHNVRLVLRLLAEFNARATFFVLGSVAAQEPELIRAIADAGHEIASHGYSHQLVPNLGPNLFRDEVRRTGDILERHAGQRPVGYRAPQWSISTSTTPWALTILSEEGYRYDSSCNPLRFVGEPTGPRLPHAVGTEKGSILEIPPMVTPSFLGNLPTGGGWGFRFFPMAMIGRTIGELNRTGNPAVLYIHPREMEPEGPRLNLPLLRRFPAYGPRTDPQQRLRSLLRRFEFGTLREVAEKWASVP